VIGHHVVSHVTLFQNYLRLCLRDVSWTHAERRLEAKSLSFEVSHTVPSAITPQPLPSTVLDLSTVRGNSWTWLCRKWHAWQPRFRAPLGSTLHAEDVLACRFC